MASSGREQPPRRQKDQKPHVSPSYPWIYATSAYVPEFRRGHGGMGPGKALLRTINNRHLRHFLHGTPPVRPFLDYDVPCLFRPKDSADIEITAAGNVTRSKGARLQNSFSGRQIVARQNAFRMRRSTCATGHPVRRDRSEQGIFGHPSETR
jgi:hypothetical protein